MTRKRLKKKKRKKLSVSIHTGEVAGAFCRVSVSAKQFSDVMAALGKQQMEWIAHSLRVTSTAYHISKRKDKP